MGIVYARAAGSSCVWGMRRSLTTWESTETRATDPSESLVLSMLSVGRCVRANAARDPWQRRENTAWVARYLAVRQGPSHGRREPLESAGSVGSVAWRIAISRVELLPEYRPGFRLAPALVLLSFGHRADSRQSDPSSGHESMQTLRPVDRRRGDVLPSLRHRCLTRGSLAHNHASTSVCRERPSR